MVRFDLETEFRVQLRQYLSLPFDQFQDSLYVFLEVLNGILGANKLSFTTFCLSQTAETTQLIEGRRRSNLCATFSHSLFYNSR